MDSGELNNNLNQDSNSQLDVESINPAIDMPADGKRSRPALICIISITASVLILSCVFFGLLLSGVISFGNKPNDNNNEDNDDNNAGIIIPNVNLAKTVCEKYGGEPRIDRDRYSDTSMEVMCDFELDNSYKVLFTLNVSDDGNKNLASEVYNDHLQTGYDSKTVLENTEEMVKLFHKKVPAQKGSKTIIVPDVWYYKTDDQIDYTIYFKNTYLILTLYYTDGYFDFGEKIISELGFPDRNHATEQ